MKLDIRDKAKILDKSASYLGVDSLDELISKKSCQIQPETVKDIEKNIAILNQTLIVNEVPEETQNLIVNILKTILYTFTEGVLDLKDSRKLRETEGNPYEYKSGALSKL